MRILHVDKYLRREGGAAGYMLDVAEAQTSGGHDVEFFAMADERNLPATYQDLFPPYRQMEPPPRGTLSKATAFATTVWSRAAEKGMEAVLDRHRPDIVHVHNIYHQLSPSILRPAAKRGIPAVMTVHDYKLVCPTYRMLDKQTPCTACLDGRFRHAAQRRCRGGHFAASAAMGLEARLHRAFGAYDHVSRLLCPSVFLREQLRAGGLETARLVHLPLFVDLPPLPQGRREGVLYAGRLSEEKGVDVLLRALALLPDEHLLVAGEGPARQALEEQARREVPGRVRFVGHLSKQGVAHLLASARVAVLPARWYENQPLSVLEAMASATPVVVSDMGGLPELVEQGRTGLVVPAEDVQALAMALRHLDGERARTMGQAARSRAGSSFSREPHLAALQDIYESESRGRVQA